MMRRNDLEWKMKPNRMKKHIAFVLIFLFLPGLKIMAQKTNRLYLSGTGKDHTVKWQFYCTGGRNSGQWTTIPVPSQWELQGFGTYNYGHDWRDSTKKIGHEKGRYKYTFSVPEAWKGESVDIVFEGSMTDTKVKINGQLAGPVHQGAFYTFKYDISDLLKYGKDNLLEVTVSKVSSNRSVNKAERESDYWIFGGIFRPVYLEAKPHQHIKRLTIDAKANGNFSANIFTEGRGDAASVTGQIMTLGGHKVGTEFNTTLNENGSYQALSTKIAQAKLWSPEFPHLYKAVFYLKDAQGNIIHQVEKRFGFRTVELRARDGFYVNGKKVRFRGVDYHAFWPSSGRTTSKALSIKDVNLMKDMNINAVRMSHYPHDAHFYAVCDSLGLFVLDELGGWQDAYDTKIGHKLVKEMVARDVNHPSIVMWDNGNEGGYNYDLDDDFGKYDPQNRPVIHPGSIFRNTNTAHYPAYNCCSDLLFNGQKVFFSTELLHGLYDGGHGAGLQDFWNLMQRKPRSAGGFLWDYADECVERTDENDSLDCDGNHAPDGILGPYRQKEGSFYAIKKIWSPVQIPSITLTPAWNQQLSVKNRFFYTNLNQVQFEWELINYPGPFNKAQKEKIVSHHRIKSPDVKPQTNGFLQLDLPKNWETADALTITATDPHGREIYAWTLPVTTPRQWVQKVIQDTTSAAPQINETPNEFVLSSKRLTVHISKESGYINEIKKDHKKYSLTHGPVEAGGHSTLQAIKVEGNNLKATFSDDQYQVSYSISDSNWLEIAYSYKPHGEKPYFGIRFDYPEKKVNGIKWAGNGPYHVWKNRLAGMEYGLWQKKYNNAITGYRWNYPEFKGYHAGLNWGVLNTDEGPITMMVASPGIYLGLFTPQFPPDPRHARAPFPSGDLSFLHAIAPIGTKFHSPDELGPSGQSNVFDYGGLHYPEGKPTFQYTNTLWFYFGEK